MSGPRTRPPGFRPFLWRAERRPNRGTYAISRMPHGLNLYLDGLPAEWLSAPEAEALSQRILGCDLDGDLIIDELSAATRAVSSKHPNVVGADLMIISIPHPLWIPRVGLRFDGAPSVHGGWFLWIVGPEATVTPSQVSTGWTVPFVSWEIVTDAPARSEVGFRSTPRRKR